ncbi:MAG: acyltransferase, partial [Bacteroidaceae bacterium]|nr:acyltransferase [Bacteroidaceae bacterium]
SLVIVNTPKGEKFLERIKPKMEWKEYTISQALAGNGMPIEGGHLTSPVDRYEFFKLLDEKPFHEVAAQLFPYEEGKVCMTWKRKLKNIIRFFYQSRKHPCQLWRDIYWNVFNSHIQGNIAEGKTIRVKSHCSIFLDKGSKIVLGGPLMIGGKRNPKSKAETRILLDPGATWTTGGAVNIQCNSDIQIFSNAEFITEQMNANMGFQVVCADKIQIGKDVRIGRDVWIRDNNGGHTLIIKGYKNSSPVIIEDGVWITSNNSITKGVRIAEGAVIGANSVVSSNVASHTMVQGNPAAVVMENVIFRP